MRSNPKNDQKKLLIAELRKAAIKHTPENIIIITFVLKIVKKIMFYIIEQLL